MGFVKTVMQNMKLKKNNKIVSSDELYDKISDLFGLPKKVTYCEFILGTKAIHGRYRIVNTKPHVLWEGCDKELEYCFLFDPQENYDKYIKLVEYFQNLLGLSNDINPIKSITIEMNPKEVPTIEMNPKEVPTMIIEKYIRMNSDDHKTESKIKNLIKDFNFNVM